MEDTQRLLYAAFQAHPGGIGTPLTEQEKERIRDGVKNSARNKEPYDYKRLLEGGDIFMRNHPVSWLTER